MLMERLLRALWSPPGEYIGGAKAAIPPWGYNTHETIDRAVMRRVTGNRRARHGAPSERAKARNHRAPHHTQLASPGVFHKASIQATEA